MSAHTCVPLGFHNRRRRGRKLQLHDQLKSVFCSICALQFGINVNKQANTNFCKRLYGILAVFEAAQKCEACKRYYMFYL